MKLRYNPQTWHTFFRVDNPTLLRMYLHDGHLRDGIVTDDETRRKLDNTIHLYCKGGTPYAIDTAICAFAELFTHSARGIPDYVEEFIAHERKVIDEINRGHVEHSLGCVLLAHFLLEFDINCLLQIREPPETRKEYPKSELIPRRLLPDQNYPYKTYLLDPFLWLLFFHDWGYLYQVPTLRRKQLLDLTNSRELKRVLKGSLMVKKKKLDFDGLWDLIRREYKKKGKMDHGVASSLILLKRLGKLPEIQAKDEDELLQKLGQDKSKLQSLKQEYYGDVLSAIAMHNLPLGRCGYKFKICDNVYYFLLKLVDEIADWSRPVRGRFWRPIEPLDHILLNVRPQPGRESAILIQAIINFRDNEYLFEAAKSIQGFDGENGKLFEVSQLEQKADALTALDFREPTNNQKWLDLEVILIDRNGRVHHLYWHNDKPLVVSEDIRQPIYQSLVHRKVH